MGEKIILQRVSRTLQKQVKSAELAPASNVKPYLDLMFDLWASAHPDKGAVLNWLSTKRNLVLEEFYGK